MIILPRETQYMVNFQRSLHYDLRDRVENVVFNPLYSQFNPDKELQFLTELEKTLFPKNKNLLVCEKLSF
jgi:hypothetical protein